MTIISKEVSLVVSLTEYFILDDFKEQEDKQNVTSILIQFWEVRGKYVCVCLTPFHTMI